MKNTFKVRGRGQFPVDMLRYDACEPATTLDEAMVHLEDYTASRRTITLRLTMDSGGMIAPARWDSFGWRVIGVPAGQHRCPRVFVEDLSDDDIPAGPPPAPSKLDALREIRHEISRINQAAGETRFNPAATQLLDALIEDEMMEPEDL